MPTKHHQIENPQQTSHTENKKNIKNNTNKIKKEIKNIFYFSWKSHKFNVTETQARWNGEMMDNLLNEIKKEWITKTEISERLEELRKEISEQYKESTWEDINLTDEQLLSILYAHKKNWKLWELTLWQLKEKVKKLSKTITDPKVRRFLLEAGFCGRETTWAKVEDSVNPNIENRLRENFWIKIDGYNIVRLSELTEEQIINVEKNKKRFENLWIKIDGYNIGRLSKLAEEQIIDAEKNQKRFENLWINIDEYNIRRLSELTEEQITNVEKNQKHFENLWIKIDGYNIRTLSELTEEEIINLEKNRWRLKNLLWDEINKLIWQMSELTEKEIWIFEKLKSIWIKIDRYNIEKLSELTEEQITNVEKNQKHFENLWIKIDGYNIVRLSELTEEQIINVEKNKKRFENLWIEVDGYNIVRLSELTEEQITNVEKNKKRFENLWIKIDRYNIVKLSQLTEEQITNVEKNQKRFENFWIKIDGYNIVMLSKLTEEQITNVEKNKKRFENLWIKPDKTNIKELCELTEKKIEILESLKNLGIKIDRYNIGRLSELTEEQIINVEKNKKRFENLWIEVDGYNINILSKLNNEQIMKIEKGEILKDIQTIKLSECDVNKKYFHFTNEKNIWGILNFWLQPKIWPASKLVNDVPNVSISEGERGMFGIIDSFIIQFSEMQINKIPEEFKIYFTDINNFSSKKILSKASVYNAICNKLKEDVYIYIDTNPKDQIFQGAKLNSWMSGFCLFDIWVHYSIEPSKLRVIADENGHILSSYDVILHLFEKAQNDCCIRLNFPNLFKMMKFVGNNYSK